MESWRNSLRAISDVFSDAGLDDHGVILEYQLPLTSCRLDCMVLGRDGAERDKAVIVELKQWTFTDRDQPIHSVCAIHEGTLVIITVYRPDPDLWEDYRVRKGKP